ncbi:MAG: VOC family protein [Dehalococcoidia bacterium]
MIDFVRFDHISMAVPDLEHQVDLLERLFGFRESSRFETGEGYLGSTLDVPGVSEIAWEVLAPSSRVSPLYRFLESDLGPGLHHLAVEVRDLAQAAEALVEETGVDPRPEDADATDVLYVHPREGGEGILYQIYASGTEPAEPFRDDGEHTMGIVAVNHVAHAHGGNDELGDWYERLFGLRTIHRSPGPGLDNGFVTRVLEPPAATAMAPQLRVEVISPTTSSSFVQRFLERRGPGMHHVTFEVGDWQRAVDACAFHDVPIFGERAGATEGVEWREAFIHPRHTGGMLAQFFWQAAPGAWI